ncbi:MAG: amino acid permease [Alphaproteobacteria bacterium]|jgi:basic amino acid/polyamine antiporter, APA family|nr:amino acid permease [Alphaproteobacteria bacterium]MBT4966423.1 amino acid permease [Alphaproteobacteria bacterium]MBT5919707.1 amino acid permease [Alphaproteobacteria bacterium]MBT6387692.1 amino acid permease [Alphaproteobacteria bacterium]
MTDQPASPPKLKRSLTLLPLTLYGLGTTIGAGIYALIGEMALVAGYQMPVSFLIAAALATLTGFSFVELSSRYPKAAGEAVYVQQGFDRRWLTIVVGLLAVSAGTVSAASIVNGFVGYLQSFTDIHRTIIIVALMLGMTVVAAWGIGSSVAAAAILTVIEIGGLAIVIAAGGEHLADLPARINEFVPTFDAGMWAGIFAGSFLAFYAFIGFEDIVNMAEETKDPTRVVPWAIILTLAVTAVLYVLVSVVALLSVPLSELAGSAAPLKLVYARATGSSGALIGVIGILAMVNGALIQLIKGARVLYGLSRQGVLPAWFGQVNARTSTPLNATLLVGAAIFILALWFRLGGLAQATSLITLGVFSLVNLALVRVKLRDDPVDHTAIFNIPIWIPLGGFAVSAGFLLTKLVQLASG